MTTEPGSLETYHKDHWVDIEPERLARYEKMFQLDDRRGDARRRGDRAVRAGAGRRETHPKDVHDGST